MAISVESVYPSENSVGVPTGIEICIVFSEEIDEIRAKSNIVITGPDFDQTSGPDSLLWIDVEKGYNPFFLQSPGYKGDLQGKFYFELLNTDNTIYSGFDYHSGLPNFKSRVKFVPDKPLAPQTTYTVYIIGDPDATDDIRRGISSRTVYTPQLGANVGSGGLVARGGYKGATEDSIVISMTSDGNIRTAEYEWWLLSNPTIVYTGITSTRYRSLTDLGVEIRFTGSNFKTGDTFTFKVYPPVYMESSYKYSFTTGSGNISALPSTTSTSVLGVPSSTSTTIDSDEFEVVSTYPTNKELKVSSDIRVIRIEFSADVDSSTISDLTVNIVAHPAVGYDYNVTDVGRLDKLLYLDGNILYIFLQKGTP